MTKIDIRYREVLLPHVTDLRGPHGFDMSSAEEVLARHGLRDLPRARRVLSSMKPGRW